MATSVLEDKDKYSELLLRISRFAGLIMPVLVILYGVLAANDYVPRSPIFSDTGFLATSLIFILVGIGQFIQNRQKSARVIAGYITVYHILGASYLIWVSGFNSPLVGCWLVLSIISEMFFGKKALFYSIAALFATALMSFSANGSFELAQLGAYFSFAIVISATALLVSKLRSVQALEHDDFQRTKVQEELERGQLMTLINSINESIISISSTGTVRVYNAATLNLLDTNVSLAGKNIDDIFHIYDEKGEPHKLVEILPELNHLVERDDLVHRFADGEEIRLAISAVPIREAFSSQILSNEGYLFIFRDITKSKSLEEERDEFISVISHELRTPITIVEGTLSNASLILSRDPDPAKMEKALHDAHEQIVFLASMVNDLGTLSRAERGVADTPEDIDVGAMLHELYGQYQPRAAAEGLALDLDASSRLGHVYASRLYLEEVIQNFLTNAIKYTKEGKVTLSAHRTKDGVHFAVKDTGIGISKSDLKRVFEKFYRSEDYRTRETSGTGLGLYVVQKLAKKLHINVEVNSRLNHGSVFEFTLPDRKDKSKLP